MKRFIRFFLVIFSMLFISFPAFSFSFFGSVEAGILYVPYMATELLFYSEQGTSKPIYLTTEEFRLGPDYKFDFNLNWPVISWDFNGEYSKNYHNFYTDVSATRERCVYSLYAHLNQYRYTGLYSDEEYNLKDITASAGGEISFNTEVIRNRVVASASAFAEAEFYNKVSIIPKNSNSESSSYYVDSKNNCFAVGFNGLVKFFNVISVGASMTSWQYFNTESETLIGGFVPIQIRNIFYTKIYHNIGKYFAADLELDYFCDHPEVPWENYKEVNRTNQSYLMIHLLGVFKF